MYILGPCESEVYILNLESNHLYIHKSNLELKSYL